MGIATMKKAAVKFEELGKIFHTIGQSSQNQSAVTKSHTALYFRKDEFSTSGRIADRKLLDRAGQRDSSHVFG